MTDHTAVAATDDAQAVDAGGFVRVDRGPIDVPLLVVAIALTGLGVIMIYSASSVVAESRYGDPSYFLSRQVMGVAMGLVALCVGMRVDYRWYRRLAYPILVVAFILLALVFIPGIGVKVGVARRWIELASVRFQPVELAKLAVAIYLAYSVSKKSEGMRSFTLAFIPHLLVVGAMVALLIPQPDYGSAVMLMVVVGLMLFLGGARIGYLVAFLIAGAVFAYDTVTSSPYHLERIQVFLNPESFRQGSGWQLNESFLALGAGGPTGLGLGEGHFKLGYVPELWNDFIGTIVGHELGLVGLGVVAVLFLIFLWRGVHVSLKARDSFGAYLAFILTTLITLQAVTNLGVVTGLLPTKGLTLPFVSYGRSSILLSLFTVGVLLNISQRNDDLHAEARERREYEKVERELAKRRARLLANQRALRLGGSRGGA